MNVFLKKSTTENKGMTKVSHLWSVIPSLKNKSLPFLLFFIKCPNSKKINITLKYKRQSYMQLMPMRIHCRLQSPVNNDFYLTYPLLWQLRRHTLYLIIPFLTVSHCFKLNCFLKNLSKYQILALFLGVAGFCQSSKVSLLLLKIAVQHDVNTNEVLPRVNKSRVINLCEQKLKKTSKFSLHELQKERDYVR